MSRNTRPRSRWSMASCVASRRTCGGHGTWSLRRRFRGGVKRGAPRRDAGALRTLRLGGREPPIFLGPGNLDRGRLADRHARERVLRQRDVLVANAAVEVELQALP